MICRASLYPCEGFSEDIGEDVWVTCSGQLILGTIYAYRECLLDRLDMDEDEISYWNREGYQMTAYKTSMGTKRRRSALRHFIAVRFLLSVFLRWITGTWTILATSMKYWIVMQTKEAVYADKRDGNGRVALR